MKTMLTLIILKFSLQYTILLCDAFITANTLLPRSTANMAICDYNDTIFLFGGSGTNSQQYVQYDTVSNTFIDIGSNILNIIAYGTAQYYTQINNFCYWIGTTTSIASGTLTASSISVVNLELENFSIGSISNSPHFVGESACLASNNEYLFIVGGVSDTLGVLNTLQIYNISSGEWKDGPNMQKSRTRHSCIVDLKRNILYAISGSNSIDQQYGNNLLYDIEKFIIDESTWTTNDMQLSWPVLDARAIISMDTILLIGGMWYSDLTSQTLAPNIQVINCNTGQTYAYISLNYLVYAASAVTLFNKIYVFGGQTSTLTTTDQWQYLALPTYAPTNAPSIHPTYPTIIPSITPTHHPTSTAPTLYFSTMYPTTYPMSTAHPSVTTKLSTAWFSTMLPTQFPLNKATTEPTDMPSVPTKSPIAWFSTMFPTEFPLNEPTTEPTDIPSEATTVQTDISSTIVSFQKNPFKHQVIAIVVVLPLIFICCILIIFYVKRNRISKHKLDNVKVEHNYVELVDKEKEGQVDFNNITTYGKKAETLTVGEYMSLESVRESDNDDASSVIETNDQNEDEDDIYQYAAPTQNNVIQNEGDIATPQGSEKDMHGNELTPTKP
eukprot:306961_1